MTITIQEIKDRTDEVGECWIWKRGTTSGYPQLKVPGRACKLVRRLVVELDGRPAEVRQPVITTCGASPGVAVYARGMACEVYRPYKWRPL